jgi:hypothetical protein
MHRGTHVEQVEITLFLRVAAAKAAFAALWSHRAGDQGHPLSFERGGHVHGLQRLRAV